MARVPVATAIREAAAESDEDALLNLKVATCRHAMETASALNLKLPDCWAGEDQIIWILIVDHIPIYY
jgi:hypothetical protein